MTSLSIWRSVRSTPVDQRDDRDPGRREAAEEAWARAHGKRAISFGKYGYLTFSTNCKKDNFIVVFFILLILLFYQHVLEIFGAVDDFLGVWALGIY